MSEGPARSKAQSAGTSRELRVAERNALVFKGRGAKRRALAIKGRGTERIALVLQRQVSKAQSVGFLKEAQSAAIFKADESISGRTTITAKDTSDDALQTA